MSDLIPIVGTIMFWSFVASIILVPIYLRHRDRVQMQETLRVAIEKGQTLGLLGPNGAGKTTTVSIISGLISADSGEVLIEGRALRGDTRTHFAWARTSARPSSLIVVAITAS